MSVETFETVRSPNVRNIRKALQGAIYLKKWVDGDPDVLTVWTAAGGLIVPADFEYVGLTSKSSAAKIARDISDSEVMSWGEGDATRIDRIKDGISLQFTMQESKKIAMEAHGGMNLSGVTPDTDGNIVIDKPSRPVSQRWRALMISKDGDGVDAIYWLDYLPLCTVTGAEDQDSSEETERTYTVTLKGMKDPVLKTAHRQIWGGPGIDTAAMGFTA